MRKVQEERLELLKKGKKPDEASQQEIPESQRRDGRADE
jgi:hypothetical protein